MTDLLIIFNPTLSKDVFLIAKIQVLGGFALEEIYILHLFVNLYVAIRKRLELSFAMMEIWVMNQCVIHFVLLLLKDGNA